MKPPSSMLGKAAVATGLAAAGAAAGVGLSRLTASKTATGDTVYKVPGLTGGVTGLLAASLVASTYGEVAKDGGKDGEGNWGDTARWTGVAGLVTLTGMMGLMLTKSLLSPPPALPAAAPMNFPVLPSDSGKTLALKVGDSASVQLPSTITAAGQTSPWTWTVPAGAPVQMAQPVPAAGGIEVDTFTAVAAGSAVLTATLATPAGTDAAGATFTLTVTVS